MRAFFRRLFSYKKTLVGLLLGSLGPYLLGLLRDELVLRGIGAAWEFTFGPAMVNDALKWMATHPWPSAIGALFLYLVVGATLSERHVRRSTQPQMPTIIAPPPQTERAVRVKYSSQQIVTSSNAPGNHGDRLNLDNAATMIQFGPCDHNVIQMILVDATPLTIERPRANVPYQTSIGVSEFPAADSPGIDIRNATFIDGTGATEYLFARLGPGRSHVVVVRTRKFRISLDAVNDRSRPGRHLIEYTFGISEE